MITFPFCKINLGLHVISKRADGYHNIETCFYPVPWKDILEIVPAKETKVFLTGNEIPGDPTSNIAFKAYQLLRREFNLDPVEIHLHKIIPHGAGLGGGSSDGAYALKLLNQLMELNLTNERLKTYALQLGSDCPFFIEAAPMVASGRGEILSPIAVDLSGLTLVIVKPPVMVSTADAYARITPRASEASLTSIIQEPLNNWRTLLKNDFEASVFSRFPVIQEVKFRLYDLGALYASMSGSGSAVFGLFKSSIALEKEFPGMIVWSREL
jgi:4-diphosphocytidyl-2-C-methyl-D-erythritol kinase